MLIGRSDVLVPAFNTSDDRTSDYSELKYSKTLTTGDEFGELGLLSHISRTATVKAAEDCLLFTLTKNEFRDMLEKQKKDAMAKKVSYFSSIPIIAEVFKGETKEFFKKLPFLFQKQKYLKGDRIIKQGKLCSGFFVVDSGSVVIQKTVKPKLQPSKDQSMCNYYQKVVILGRQDTFGEIELFSNKGSTFDYVVDSPVAEVFMMTKNQFNHLLFRARISKLNVKHIAKERFTRYLMEFMEKKMMRDQFYVKQNFSFNRGKPRTGSLDEKTLKSIKDELFYSGSQGTHFKYINQIQKNLCRISEKKFRNESKSPNGTRKINLLPFERKLAGVGRKLIGQYSFKDDLLKDSKEATKSQKFTIEPFDSIKRSLDNIFGGRNSKSMAILKKKRKRIKRKQFKGIKTKEDFEKELALNSKKFGLGNIDQQMDRLRKMLDKNRMQRAKIQREKRIQNTKQLVERASIDSVTPMKHSRSRTVLPSISSGKTEVYTRQRLVSGIAV